MIFGLRILGSDKISAKNSDFKGKSANKSTAISFW
jgi:hypothetical protein